MTIGIDISQIVFKGTGVATYTESLVAGLSRLDKANDYVLLATSLRQRAVFANFTHKLAPGFNYRIRSYPLPPYFLNLLWNRLHVLPVEILAGKLDIFHSSDWVQPPSRARKVTTVHDLLVYRYPQASHHKQEFNWQSLAPSMNIVAVQKAKLAWVKKECDVIIADSQATKRDCVEYLHISPDRVKVIYLAAGEEFRSFGRDTKDREAKVSNLKRQYSLPEKYVLAVGTREPRKNLDRLIRAFTALDYKDVKLVIAGKYGWGENQSFAAKSVQLLGYVPQGDLPALYAGAQVFVYPSLYEGFGVPVLEAMAAGCPVICSHLGSLPEVGGNVAAYVNPLNEADITARMAEGLGMDDKEREAVIAKGKVWAGTFTWEKTARETLKIYEEME